MTIITNITDDEVTRYIVIDNGVIRCDITNKTPNVCFISSLMVDEHSRKNGNAKKLIQSAEDYAKKRGCNVISLQARYGSWMLDWYKRLGYIPNVMWDSENVLMTKEIKL